MRINKVEMLLNAKYEYFETPTQLVFWIPDDNCYCGGIGFHDLVICGCCGSTIPLDEIYEDAPKNRPAIITFDAWIDISTEIIGDSWPEIANEIIKNIEGE